MIKLKINGKTIETEVGSILNVALENDIHIPHFCYDERLEAYGGCGMCVVEVEGNNKLVRSCAQNVQDGMVVTTNTERAERARKVAMDLYMSDHRGDCLAPCQLGCPADCDAQGYVGLISNNQPIEATKLIKESIPIPSAIGRICPAPCESNCRREVIEEPISIAQLKYFASDQDLYSDNPYLAETAQASGKTVGVIGAGAAGLSIAHFLAIKGHKPVVYEMMPGPGGMLRYGIPEYRLPNEILDKETELIEKLGAEIHYNVKVGDDISLEELREKHDAIFVGIGAWKAGALYAENEDAKGVLGGIDFLREAYMGTVEDIGDDVLVVGGGNTAMDVCRTAVRLGAKNVTIVYRRTQEYMPAQPREIVEAMEEGVDFKFLLAQKEVVVKDGKAVGLRCEKMVLGEPDASGRQRPEGTGEFIELKASTIIGAVGQKVDMGNIQGIELTKWGTIDAENPTYQTNLEGVFAGGDVVTGPKDAVDAVGAAKYAAVVIDSYLNGEIAPRDNMRLVERHDMTKEDFPRINEQSREQNKHMSAEERRTNFECMTYTLSEEAALTEASRCLECGCDAYYDCDLLEGIREYRVDTAREYEDQHRRVVEDIHDYIELDNDKCVQCSLCVRVCQDLIGVAALGLVERGFDGFVAPEFDGELRNSSCISCNGCIEICPTGAFREKQHLQKDIPLATTEVASVCTQCDLACDVIYHMSGDRIYKVTANNDSGILCQTGKFEYEFIQDSNAVNGALPKDLGKIAFLLSPIISDQEASELKSLASKFNAEIYINETNFDEVAVDGALTEQVQAIIADNKRVLNTLGLKDFGSCDELVKELPSVDTIVYIGNKVRPLESLDVTNRIVMSANKDMVDVADLYIPYKDAVYYDCSFTKSNGESVEISRLLSEEFASNMSVLQEHLLGE